MRLPERRTALLVACFFLSGAASLMAQVVWLRYLALTFGNTTQAAATLLAVFMGGLGLGAFLFGRLADRWRRPLLAYANNYDQIRYSATLKKDLLYVAAPVLYENQVIAVAPA